MVEIEWGMHKKTRVVGEKMDVIRSLKGNLIVSCQALEDEPLYCPGFMARMAKEEKP